MKICLKKSIFSSSSKDEIMTKPILVFILFGCIFVYFTGLFPESIPEGVSYFFRFIIPAFLCFRAITKLNSRNLGYLIVFELVFLFSYFWAYISGNVDRNFIILYLIMTMFFCVPFGIFIAQIDDLNVLYSGLVRISFPVFGIVTAYFLLKIRNTTTIWGEASYSMPAGYQLLLSLCIFTNEIFKKEPMFKRSLYIICSVVSFVMIFLYGSRGSLACYAAFLIYKLLISYKDNRRVRFVTIVLGLIIVVCGAFSDVILNKVISLLQSLGIASRTVTSIVSNRILEDSGRGDILSKAIILIKSNPIIGSGASSDLVLMGGYPHNLFAELCIDFGAILGLFFSLVLIKKIIMSLFICGESDKSLAGVFFACGFCMLMLSSTYLQNIYLFMFLGLMARKNNSKSVHFIITR